MPLNAAQKKNLRGRAHHLKPFVTVADKGLSASVVAEIERALNDHELIKVKLAAEKAERSAMIETITAASGALLVQHIGQIAVLFRRNEKKPKVVLPSQ